MKVNALTQSEIDRINEIYQEMGLMSYDKELEKTLKKIKRQPKQIFFTSDELNELYSFCKNYQGLKFA